MSLAVSSLRAYQDALAEFSKTQKKFDMTAAGMSTAQPNAATSFGDTLRSSLDSVNQLQQDKNEMVKSFASGENQNVHELMISMQKAGLAVNLTAAVRNKVLEAYKELSRLQF